MAYLKSLNVTKQQISYAQDFLKGWIHMDCSKQAQKLQANVLRIFGTEDDCAGATEALADTWRQLGHEAVQRDTGIQNDQEGESLRTC